MTRIAGNTIDEFLKNAGTKFGANGLGVTHYVKPGYKYEFKKGNLSKLVFDDLKITVDYAEAGSGSPTPVHKQAIDDVADLAKAHEERHKAGYQAAFKKWDPDQVAKDLMADTYKDEKEAVKAIKGKLDDLEIALNDAFLDLHKKEGVIIATTSINVKMQPAGAAGCR